jgi:hypothetical protein
VVEKASKDKRTDQTSEAMALRSRIVRNGACFCTRRRAAGAGRLEEGAPVNSIYIPYVAPASSSTAQQQRDAISRTPSTIFFSESALLLLLPLADCNLIRLERQRPLSRVSRVVLFLAHFYFCHQEQTQQQLYLCLLNRMLRTTKAHSNEATQSSNGYCCRRRQ